MLVVGYERSVSTTWLEDCDALWAWVLFVVVNPSPGQLDVWRMSVGM